MFADPVLEDAPIPAFVQPAPPATSALTLAPIEGPSLEAQPPQPARRRSHAVWTLALHMVSALLFQYLAKKTLDAVTKK